LKALVVGYGSIGKRHIENLSKYKNIQILVCTQRKNDYFLKKRKCKIFNSIESSLKEGPDIALITNESSNHIFTCIKLAKKNIDLFIEKPLSNSIKKVDELTNIVKKKKLITQMGFPLRFHPCLKEIRKIILEKNLGDIIFINIQNGSYLPDWHLGEDYRKNYAARDDLGGGVLFTSTHELDYLSWIFGNVSEVFSITGKYSNLEIKSDDLSTILMKFKNNVIAEIHLDFFQKPKIRDCKIVGTKGVIYWNFDQNIIRYFDFKNEKWVNRLKLNKYNNNSMYEEELKHFLNCVKKRQKSINDIFEGKKNIEIALAIKKSSKVKRMVKIS
jgi:predicted dehydrogenase